MTATPSARPGAPTQAGGDGSAHSAPRGGGHGGRLGARSLLGRGWELHQLHVGGPQRGLAGGGYLRSAAQGRAGWDGVEWSGRQPGAGQGRAVPTRSSAGIQSWCHHHQAAACPGNQPYRLPGVQGRWPACTAPPPPPGTAHPPPEPHRQMRTPRLRAACHGWSAVSREYILPAALRMRQHSTVGPGAALQAALLQPTPPAASPAAGMLTS